jgi:hypothetical protein
MILDQCNDLPLGVAPDVIYEETVLRLLKGDQIIFYTDGITEAHNPGGELFGTARSSPGTMQPGGCGKVGFRFALSGGICCPENDFQ